MQETRKRRAILNQKKENNKGDAESSKPKKEMQ
jgi:hypothetical protein